MEAYAREHSSGEREHAVSKAQEMMYAVWERKTLRAQHAVVMKALAACPLCADAFNHLALDTGDQKKKAELYTLGCKAGELALGPEGFAEFHGQFWGFLETRPYMRARHGLALALLELGERGAAVAHFRAMLDLNPGDNQGIRYLLLSQLLIDDAVDEAKSLLAAYGEEWSVQWLYTRALFAYREGRKASKSMRSLLKDAFEENSHVPAILAGTEPPIYSEDGFVMVGGPEEATDYVQEFGGAWEKTEGAIDWLASQAHGAHIAS